ncbi:restriction endonuclease [Natrinema pallidum DSM 3751]|uniref:Restriction endonuclease n=1 Tax=Natrinema pallidum DSM 3751 TaxID=1227495 RepID=L9YVI9_9EURY|nr:restriction endonuclease [Natrinema pallidum]ELY78240.1 restriction endonuclease [Natrinema pallidum DSM 3751]
MTGIVIFTAGREDAYDDYKRSLKRGHPLEDLEPYLSDEELEDLEATSEDGRAHLWGSSVAGKWQNVEPGDIGFVYREGKFVSRGRVLLLSENHELAKHLWKDGVDHDRWNVDKPWKYLTFLTDIEEIEVDIEEFNDLVDYDETYRPQGFTRVADSRLARLRDEYESIETALSELSEAGEKVHQVDETDDEKATDLASRLEAASTNGDDPDEFEKLVAKAFTRLGCATNWIEGGGDTDVEIKTPRHIVVEAKTRGNGKLNSLEATNVDKHRRQRGAEHAIVVAPSFSPKVIENATTNELTTIAVDDLIELLARRERYAIPPEQTLELLTRPGSFQDDRLDLLDENIQDRVDAGETLLAVIRALERADGLVETAADVRWIVVGMQDSDEVPSERDVKSALQLLGHPSIGVVEQTEEGYRIVTSYENAVQLVRSLGEVVQPPEEEK